MPEQRAGKVLGGEGENIEPSACSLPVGGAERVAEGKSLLQPWPGDACSLRWSETGAVVKTRAILKGPAGHLPGPQKKEALGGRRGRKLRGRATGGYPNQEVAVQQVP